VTGFDAYAGTAENLRARKAVEILRDLMKDLSKASGGAIPRTLKDAQVSEYALRDIAQEAVGNEAIFDMDDCLKILREAWEGR
jgi:flagellin-specific chaperone FliS